MIQNDNQSVRITSTTMSLGKIRRPGDVIEVTKREAQELIFRRLAEPFQDQLKGSEEQQVTTSGVQASENNDTQSGTDGKRSRK